MKILVIGAGIFGSSIALELAKDPTRKIDLVDKEKGIMNAASKCNHNRLHLGYHYLRSIPTANQSLQGLLSFMFNYGDALISQFPNYYAIAKEGSHTSTEEFLAFCDTVGIGYAEDYPSEKMMNRSMVDSCFRVPEPIFDYDLLKTIVNSRLHKSKNIQVKLKSSCNDLTKKGSTFYANIEGKEKEYDIVINATYANINRFNDMLGLPLHKLRFEHVFIPYFLYPSDKFGMTVMDGNFCSIMPKGSNKNEFLLYHVVDSVLDRKLGFKNNIKKNLITQENVTKIYKNSQDFYPFLKDTNHFGHWNTIRTVYDNKNDARLSELISYGDIDGYFSILSGKITTCMQVALKLNRIINGKTINKTVLI